MVPPLRRLTAPRAAAVAGILFAVLFATSLILMRTGLGDDPFVGSQWYERGAAQVRVALFLLPYAGISFLWFIGVVRDRLGEFEDRFFATIFLGSGLVFLAMVFVSSAIAGGLLVYGGTEAPAEDVAVFGRVLMLQISNIYALRMAGVFMISLGTIWLRTGLMPRSMALVTYAVAVVLLFVTDLSLWVTMVFPAWVFAVSVGIIVLTRRRGREQAASAVAPDGGPDQPVSEG